MKSKWLDDQPLKCTLMILEIASSSARTWVDFCSRLSSVSCSRASAMGPPAGFFACFAFSLVPTS
eukprot:12195859-Alexandrium_andersonii.AAC.1